MTSRDKIDKAGQATEYEKQPKIAIILVGPKRMEGHVVPRKLGLSPAGVAARAPIAPSHSSVQMHHLHALLSNPL